MADRDARAPSGTDINSAIRNMITIIDQIVEVTEEENRLYEDGHPAPPAGIVAMKTTQADRLSASFEDLRDRKMAITAAEPDLRSALTERVHRMRSVMEENTQRLNRARAASRRRIDAIMQVVREETRQQPTAYGDSGRMTSRGSPPPAVRLSTEA